MILKLRYFLFILAIGYGSRALALESCYFSQRNDLTGYSVSVFQKGNIHPIQQVRSSTALFEYLTEIDGTVCSIDWKKARDQFDYTLNNFAGQSDQEGLKIEYYPLFDKKISAKVPEFSSARESASN